jgi:hypothetical protein
MAESLENNSFWRSSIVQAFMLSSICSFSWLYAHCLIQYGIFGGIGGAGDRDFGLATILSGWALAIFIGGLLAGPIARSIIGQYSLSGFIAIALSVPAASFNLWLSPFGSEIGLGRFLSRMFYFIGGAGVLTEGRKGWAPFHSFYFLWIYAFSFLGFFVTACLAKRNKPAKNIAVQHTYITVNNPKR